MSFLDLCAQQVSSFVETKNVQRMRVFGAGRCVHQKKIFSINGKVI